MAHKEINDKEMRAVSALPTPRRLEHFIKTVADWEGAWGLYDDGWATSGTNDGVYAFSLWPAQRYAELCAASEWSGYSAEAIPLDDLMELLIPKLRKEGSFFEIFRTSSEQGAAVSPDELLALLDEELQQY